MAKISESHKTKIRKKVNNRLKTRPFKIPKFPDKIALEYSKAIIKEINKIDDLVKKILIPKLKKITNTKDERLDSSIRVDDIRKLAGVALVAELIRRMKSEFYGEFLGQDQEPTQLIFSRSVRGIAEKFMNRSNQFGEKVFVDEFENQTGTLPLDKHLNVNEFIQDATRKNVSLIKTIPSQYFNQIQTLVEQAVDKGQLTREVQKELVKINDTAKNRARLIARDQVAKLVGITEEARQRNVGVTHYIWKTMEDSRVRSFSNSNGYSDHKRLDGTLQKWSSPPVTVFKGKRAGERNHPGQDINCFLSGTMIKTENGKKPIEEIKIGDIVHSHWGLQKVVETHKNNYNGQLTGIKLLHKTIWLTPRHKVFTSNRGWVCASSLKPHDKLVKLQKLFTCNFLNKKSVRDIEHPHPHLISQKQMSIGVDCYHRILNLYNCVKFIKFKIGLIIRAIFPIRFFKLPLRSIFNAKDIKPCGANYFRFWDYPVFAIPVSRLRGCGETCSFPLRVFDPLGGDSFATIPDFYPVMNKNTFNHSAGHPGGLCNISVRPKIIGVFFSKPRFKWFRKFNFCFFKPIEKKTFIGAFFGTINPSFVFELAFSNFKNFIAAFAASLKRSFHNVYLKFISFVKKEHLHYVVVDILSQQYNGYVYNFGVDKSMSYFAENFLVENCRCLAQPVYDKITGIDHPETLAAIEKTKKINRKTS